MHRYVIVCHAHKGAGRGQARARGEFYLRCVVGVGPGRQGSQLRALQQETHLGSSDDHQKYFRLLS